MKITTRLLLVPLMLSAGFAQDESLEKRIARVETGLIPAVHIAGTTGEQWPLADRMAHYKVPGVSIAVINEGRIEWARAYGMANAADSIPLTPRSLLRGASLSKPITATAALRLVELGVISLDRDVNASLVSWQIPPSPKAQGKAVTLRMLLSHSSGLANAGPGGYAPGQPLPTLLQVLDGLPPAANTPVRLEAEPGTKFRYNVSYLVLEQLLIDLEKKPFHELISARVFKPAGMEDSSFAHPLPRELAERTARGHDLGGALIKEPRIYVTQAQGGIWTTPTDVAHLAVNLIHSLRGEPGILQQATAGTMLTQPLPGSLWALGVHRLEEGGETRLSHGGNAEGFKSLLVIYPQTRRGAVVMTNGENGGRVINEVIRSIAKEYQWPGYQAVDKTLVTLPAGAVDRFIGEYTSDDTWLKFLRHDGRFYMENAAQGRIELFAEGPASFFSTEIPDVFAFSLDPDGRATGVTRIGPASQIFKRVTP